MLTPNENAILATLTYFNLFSYPLTAMEIWKWLYQEPGAPQVPLSEIVRLLRESNELRDRIGEREGMFFLAGEDVNVGTRKERYLIAERKFQRLRRALRVLRCLPFIRAVAVCNSLSYSNARDESDLDLLIVTRPGRVWTTRMFATGVSALLRWRPTKASMRDTVCLSFYIADSRQSLRQLTLSDHDLYFRYWLDQLTPMYGDLTAFDELRAANNWYADRLPNAFGAAPVWRRIVRDTRASYFLKRVAEGVHSGVLGDLLERRYHGWQERRLPKALQMLANKDTRVVLNDQMLKFHENDRRQEFIDRHAMKLREVLG